ncbi:hypothetical protein ACUY4R_001912 [Kosakonia sp. BK9b]
MLLLDAIVWFVNSFHRVFNEILDKIMVQANEVLSYKI